MARWFAPRRTETWRCGSRSGLQPSKSNFSIAGRTTSLAVFRPYFFLWASILAISETGRSKVSGAEAERVAMTIGATEEGSEKALQTAPRQRNSLDSGSLAHVEQARG